MKKLVFYILIFGPSFAKNNLTLIKRNPFSFGNSKKLKKIECIAIGSTGNNSKKFAVLDHNNESKLAQTGDTINNFTVHNVLDNSLIFRDKYSNEYRIKIPST